MNDPKDYNSGGMSKCCSAEIKNGFCSDCKEHCEPENTIANYIEDAGFAIDDQELVQLLNTFISQIEMEAYQRGLKEEQKKLTKI